jgi:hypothetical protein
MKRIDNFLLKQAMYGKLSVDGKTFTEALEDAGFRAGDLISVVVTRDLRMAEAEREMAISSKEIAKGQRRAFNLGPESVFTIMGRDPGFSNYWRIKFDGRSGQEASYKEEYIARRTFLFKEARAVPAALQPRDDS